MPSDRCGASGEGISHAPFLNSPPVTTFLFPELLASRDERQQDSAFVVATPLHWSPLPWWRRA
ncbi:hypothetical protein KCP71_24305 [Salmonella enterica subsp. enterica]|nr:hypothetical protein KCP71_24305 [Salmonella enterica subsp. enterica]